MRDFHLPGRSPVLAENGMCATSHPLAAKVAVNILEAGGNAMDAAIAGALVLGIAEPHMCGIGGDAFVLFSPAGSDEVRALNGSGRAPAALRAAALRERGIKKIDLGTPDAVTVPGAVDAFCRLLDDWSQIGRDAVFAPAIHYAEAGVPVAPRVASDWARAQGNLRTDAARRVYLTGGAAPALGSRFRSPGVAEVLRRISARGRGAFYTGEVADDMLAALRAQGGVHTSEDFANTAADYTDPISGTYGGVEIVEHPPNGQGATALLLANILSQFDVAAMDPFGLERAHLEVEATKLAYDARNRMMGDPDHTTRVAHMTDPDVARRLAAFIDRHRATAEVAPLTEEIHRDTIYITVVDKNRMAVSLIHSLFHSFGSGIASDRFGILFQNRGSAFCLEDGHPNEAMGGRRPMHTIIPGVLRQGGKVLMPFGVMGGQYQATGHARFVSNLVDFGMDPQEAIDAPRLFPENGELRVERGYGAAVHNGLAEMGHPVVVPDEPIGGAQAIRIEASGVLLGASDPRKDGLALGY